MIKGLFRTVIALQNVLAARLSTLWAAKLDTLEARLSVAWAAKLDALEARLSTEWAADLDCKSSDAGGIVPTGWPTLGMNVSSDVYGWSSPYFMIATFTAAGYTANTLKTVFEVTGRGALTFLGVENKNTTSRTHRIKVTIDGVVVFDVTSSTVITDKQMIRILGWYDTVNGVCYGFVPMKYNTSLKIEHAVSNSEDYPARVGYQYFER